MEALSTLYCVGGFDDAVALKLLNHADPHVRAWTVRLIGDQGALSKAIAGRLVVVAGHDSSVIVRRQLACTARRLPAGIGLPIAVILAERERTDDLDDPYVPLLVWWAIENFAVPSRDTVLTEFTTPRAWQAPLHARFSPATTDRALRRRTKRRRRPGLSSTSRQRPDRAARLSLWAALDEGWRGRTSIDEAPAELAKLATSDWQTDRNDAPLARLAMRLGVPAVQDYVVTRALDAKTDEAVRGTMLGVLAEVGTPAALAQLAPLLNAASPPAMQSAALRAGPRQ